MPRTFDHPALGRLQRQYGAWRGTSDHAGRQIAISVKNGWRRPDDGQIELLVAVLGEIASFDRAALEFARAEFDPDKLAEQQLAEVDFDPRQMELIAVDVHYPASGWRERSGVPRDALIFVLQYAVPDDLNVVDVVFVDKEPVEVDYH